MADLKEQLKLRVLEDMIHKARGSSSSYLAMVVDDFTLGVVSSCLRMHEMNDAGVAVVLNIGYQVEKMAVPAIYFVQPTQESITRMLEHFPAAAGERKFAKAHVFIAGRLDKLTLDRIADSPMLPSIATLVETPFEFLASEDRVYSLGRERSLHTIYSPDVPARQRIDELNRTAQQIVSLCVALGEYPAIRFCKSSKVSCDLAKLVDSDFKATLDRLSSFAPSSGSTLLILDRSSDPVAPLMHEATYESMIHDLLTVNGDEVAPEEAAAQDATAAPLLLSQEDELWLSLREKHIAYVMKSVPDQFKEFCASNAAVYFKKMTVDSGSAAPSARQMKDAMLALPQYRELVKRFHRHTELAERLYKKFNERNLRVVIELEQTMVTGRDDEGKKVKKKDMQKALSDIIADQSISREDKLRLVMVYIISQEGIDEQTRRQLFKAADFTHSQQTAVTNLAQLDVTLQSSRSSKRTKLPSDRLKQLEERAALSDYKYLRWSPLSDYIVRKHVDGSLSQSDYPFIGSPPPLRASQAPARKKGLSKRKGGSRRDEEPTKPTMEPSGPRTIVFIAGGVSWSEIRAAHELAASGVDVLLGSSSLISSTQFLTELSAEE